MKNILLYMLIAFLLIVAACGVAPKDPYYLNKVALSTKPLVLKSPNEGIYPDTSVMDDEDNNFHDFHVRGDWNLLKWDIQQLDTRYAREKFYVWATFLTLEGWGEPQFYTAKAIHELAVRDSSLQLTNHAIKAYKNCLEYFFEDMTYTTGGWPMAINLMCYDGIVELGGQPSGYAIVEQPYQDPDNAGLIRTNRFVIKTPGSLPWDEQI